MPQRNNSAEVGEDWVIAPAAGRIAVELEGRTDKIGSLYIPDTARPDKPSVGRVVAHGGSYELDGEEYVPLYNVNEYVIFGRYVGIEVTVGRTKVVLMNEKDVLARLIPPEKVSDLNARVPKVHVGDHS